MDYEGVAGVDISDLLIDDVMIGQSNQNVSHTNLHMHRLFIVAHYCYVTNAAGGSWGTEK